MPNAMALAPRRPNLLRIDDVLLRAGGMLLLAWLLGGAIWLGIATHPDAPAAVQGTWGWVLLAGSAPLGAFVAGLRVRARERRAWALHRLVDDHVELSAADLLRGSDFTPETLDRAIRDLNNAAAAFIVWDRESGLVQDGRLRGARVVFDTCGSCGGHVSLKLSLSDAADARCPYCSGPVAAGARLAEEKARLIDELDTDPEPPSRRSDADFSLGVFVLLTFLCWPLGVGYALWKWHRGHTG
jgi:hypothetical protein